MAGEKKKSDWLSLAPVDNGERVREKKRKKNTKREREREQVTG
jgi:hypothetical protein